VSQRSPEPRALRRSHEQGPVTEYLAVRLAGELYAVPLSEVREILVPPPLTAIPRAPREVMGILSVRGLLVTVIDPRHKLRLVAPPPTRRARILLVPQGPETMGLFVEEVLQVYRLSDAEIEIASTVLGANLAEYVAAIARRDDRLLILLSLGPLLGSSAALGSR
jgi:purine-binding chemotaxis protein CheW